MPIADVPLMSMLRTKMHWHQERQRLLAENVANADTPNFKPRDLTPPAMDTPQGARSAAGLGMARTDPKHLVAGAGNFGGGGSFRSQAGGYEIRPGGNAVNLEDEMMKVASNQMDYQAATSLYSRSLALLKTAVGKR